MNIESGLEHETSQVEAVNRLQLSIASTIVQLAAVPMVENLRKMKPSQDAPSPMLSYLSHGQRH